MVDRFVTAYSDYLGQALILTKYRDRPDAEVQNTVTGDKFGVEVTGVYEGKRQAMIQLSRLVDWESAGGTWRQLVASLFCLLRKKARLSRTYDFPGRVLLAIYIGSVNSDSVQDADYLTQRVQRRRIPWHRFSEIWLMARANAGSETVLVPMRLEQR